MKTIIVPEKSEVDSLKSELKSTRKLLKEIQEMSLIGTWQLDFATDQVDWSSQAYQIMGEHPDMINPSLEAFLSHIHPCDLPKVERIINAHLRSERNYSFCCRIITPDGKGKHVFCKGLFEKDRNGMLIRLYGIIHDITELKEMQNRASLSEMMGQENERERLSKELHDGLGQMLVGINFRLNSICHLLKNSQPELAASIGEINQDVVNTIKEVRSVSHNLSPHLLQKYGLAEALENICRSMSGLQMTFQGSLHAVPNEHISIILYRCAQELITNISRHANATKGKIILKDTKKEISLIIEDNGKGFPSGKKNTPDGIGIQSIRNRLELVNGHLKISRGQKGIGCRMEITIPIK